MTGRKKWNEAFVILVLTIVIALSLFCGCETGADAKYLRQIDVTDLTLEVSMGLS